MDFQEAFLTLFWLPWVLMLAASVSATFVVGVYWVAIRSTKYATPSQTHHRFAGVGDSDDDE